MNEKDQPIEASPQGVLIYSFTVDQVLEAIKASGCAVTMNQQVA
jgi:hypothetical protein